VETCTVHLADRAGGNWLVVKFSEKFLNIMAKFPFIFYIQRIKDKYCTKLQAKRELYRPKNAKHRDMEGELNAVMLETLSFLGMSQHFDRILSLLANANITSTKQIAALSHEESMEKKIPWDIVRAMQKRLRVWRLETKDNAEVDLEEGEGHYGKGQRYLGHQDEDSDSFPSEADSQELPGTPEESVIPATKFDVPSRPTSGNSKGKSQRRKSLDVIDKQVGQLSQQSGAVELKLQYLVQKMDDFQLSCFRSDADRESGLLSKIEVLIDTAANRTEQNIGSMSDALRNEVHNLGKHSTCIAEQVETSSKSQEVTLGDMRRQHMMLMELVSTDRDSVHSKIQDLASALNVKLQASRINTKEVNLSV